MPPGCTIGLSSNPETSSNRLRNRRKANHSITLPLRAIEHGVIVVEERQAENRLIGLFGCRTLRDLEDGLTGGWVVGLPIGGRCAGEFDGFAIGAGEDEVNAGPFGQIEH
jgi:hypothetical protein